MYAQPVIVLEASLFSTLRCFQLFTRVGESSLTLLFTFFFINIGRRESITLARHDLITNIKRVFETSYPMMVKFLASAPLM